MCGVDDEVGQGHGSFVTREPKASSAADHHGAAPLGLDCRLHDVDTGRAADEHGVGCCSQHAFASFDQPKAPLGRHLSQVCTLRVGVREVSLQVIRAGECRLRYP